VLVARTLSSTCPIKLHRCVVIFDNDLSATVMKVQLTEYATVMEMQLMLDRCTYQAQ
jgi:hypothetical protein